MRRMVSAFQPVHPMWAVWEKAGAPSFAERIDLVCVWDRAPSKEDGLLPGAEHEAQVEYLIREPDMRCFCDVLEDANLWGVYYADSEAKALELARADPAHAAT